MLPQLLPIVLVHGGLYEEMTPDEFWVEPGVLRALAAANADFIAPQRPPQPRSWQEESEQLLDAMDEAGYEQVALVGASNGCSAAARLAIDHPERVARLMLAWPATAGDQVLDDLARIIIEDQMGPAVAGELLGGETLRGITDKELGSLSMPLVVFPSMPANHAHQRETVTSLLRAQPNGFVAGGSPEPLDDQFPEFRDTFVHLVTEFSRVEVDD